MTQHNPTAQADDFIERAVGMLFRIISAGTSSSRAIPMVAAEMGVDERDLRDAFGKAFDKRAEVAA